METVAACVDGDRVDGGACPADGEAGVTRVAGNAAAEPLLRLLAQHGHRWCRPTRRPVPRRWRSAWSRGCPGGARRTLDSRRRGGRRHRAPPRRGRCRGWRCRGRRSFADQLGDDLAVARVERGGRLVKQQQRKLGDESARDVHALLLATGEGGGRQAPTAARGWRAWRAAPAARSRAAAARTPR